MENKKVLLSVKDLHVKFRVRGRTLTAIRGISLDFYENESVAIVGESGSGKSVFTKTFAGMLDSNGYISEGSILFNDPELSDTVVRLDGMGKNMVNRAYNYLNKASSLEFGAEIYKKMQALKAQYAEAIKQAPTEEMKARNLIIAKEIYLSIGRYGFFKRENLLYKLGEYLKTLPNMEKLEVLPYHALGAVKYENLGMDYVLKDTPQLTKQQAKEAEEMIFKGMGKI